MLNWKPSVTGNIFVGAQEHPVLATWFGGDDDPMDDGQTASGLVTKGNPTMVGCALPMPTCPATHGSPLPVMPYLKTMVHVQTLLPSGIVVSQIVPIIDLGPALDTGHAIDLTQQTFKDLHGDLNVGILKVWFTIIGAAQYIFP